MSRNAVAAVCMSRDRANRTACNTRPPLCVRGFWWGALREECPFPALMRMAVLGSMAVPERIGGFETHPVLFKLSSERACIPRHPHFNQCMHVEIALSVCWTESQPTLARRISTHAARASGQARAHDEVRRHAGAADFGTDAHRRRAQAAGPHRYERGTTLKSIAKSID